MPPCLQAASCSCASWIGMEDQRLHVWDLDLVGWLAIWLASGGSTGGAGRLWLGAWMLGAAGWPSRDGDWLNAGCKTARTKRSMGVSEWCEFGWYWAKFTVLTWAGPCWLLLWAGIATWGLGFYLGWIRAAVPPSPGPRSTPVSDDNVMVTTRALLFMCHIMAPRTFSENVLK